MKLEDIVIALGMVHEFRYSATPAMFTQAFGERVGSHLWNKFVSMDYDVIGLWSYLDGWNRKVLVSMVYGMETSSNNK